MHFSTKDLVNITGGRLLSGPVETWFSGAVIDSRKAQPGDLFVPLQGEKENGHQYMFAALEQGAAGSLLEYGEIPGFSGLEFPPGKVILAVENALQALQRLARAHRQKFNLPVVAVTGSNGKTTTKDFIAAVLAVRSPVLKTEGNLNNHIGLPLMLLRIKGEHQGVVLEMGMSGYGEIALLTSLCSPNLGVITNIGEAHLEMLGSRANIARAKGELLEGMAPGSTAFLNADDPFLRPMGARFSGQVCTFGFAEEADFRALHCGFEASGYYFTARTPSREDAESYWIPLPGRHNVYNALAALAVGEHLQLTPREIRAGLAAAEVSAMRMERCFAGSGFWIVNDAYNASPTSVQYALDYLVEWAGAQRKIAVLGDMLELGEASETAHRAVGRYAAEKGVDVVFTLGERAKLVAEGALQAGISPEHVFACTDYEEILHRLERFVEKGVTILIKGSRGMKMERIAAMLQARYPVIPEEEPGNS